MPDEVYYFGAQSHIKVSSEQPEYTGNVDRIGTLRFLEEVRDIQEASGQLIKFYQAGTSEMFGAASAPQSEATPFYPRSPYSIAKVLHGGLERKGSEQPLQPFVFFSTVTSATYPKIRQSDAQDSDSFRRNIQLGSLYPPPS
jgi:UDP-glucose 4-epimerase